MNTEEFKRKLTAILSADVVGYSRLMSADEAATVKTLTTYREIMASLIKRHSGARGRFACVCGGVAGLSGGGPSSLRLAFE